METGSSCDSLLENVEEDMPPEPEPRNGRFRVLLDWAKAHMTAIGDVVVDICCRGVRSKEPTTAGPGMRRNPKVKMSGPELLVARDMLKSSAIEYDWSQIAGREDTRLRIFRALQIPENNEKNFKPKLTKVGVVLYGPAHCGKSTMVLATAKHTGSQLIRVSRQVFNGRNTEYQQRITKAVIALAAMGKPSLVFIQRLDCFSHVNTSPNNSGPQPLLKTYLLSMLESLVSSECSQIHLMATASSLEGIDEDLLTKFQATIHVPLPNSSQRESILGRFLREEPTSDDINLKQLSMLTSGFNTGDLQQLCRTAALYRVRDCIEDNPWINPKSSGPSDDEYAVKSVSVRPINMNDMRTALMEVRKSGYRRSFGSDTESQTYNTFKHAE